MSRLHASTAAALVGCALITPPAHAADDEAPPGQVTVDIVTENGRRCPGGTTSAAMKADKRSMVVQQSDMTASTGPGAPPRQDGWRCAFEIEMKIAVPYAVGVKRLTHAGRTSITADVKATNSTTTGPRGAGDPVALRSDASGPFDGDFHGQVDVAPADVIWSVCQTRQLIRFDTEVGLSPATTIQPNTTTLSTNTVDFVWRRCS